MMENGVQPLGARTACGGKLKDTTGYPSAIYQGEQIYFCTQACLRAFEKDPDRFMAGEIEHPLDEVDSSAMS
jgi:YHS domain-containing protein